MPTLWAQLSHRTPRYPPHQGGCPPCCQNLQPTSLPTQAQPCQTPGGKQCLAVLRHTDLQAGQPPPFAELPVAHLCLWKEGFTLHCWALGAKGRAKILKFWGTWLEWPGSVSSSWGLEGLDHELNWKHQNNSGELHVPELLFWKLLWSLQQWSVQGLHGWEETSISASGTCFKTSMRNVLRCEKAFFPFNVLFIPSKLVLICSLWGRQSCKWETEAPGWRAVTVYGTEAWNPGHRSPDQSWDSVWWVQAHRTGSQISPALGWHSSSSVASCSTSSPWVSLTSSRMRELLWAEYTQGFWCVSLSEQPWTGGRSSALDYNSWWISGYLD